MQVLIVVSTTRTRSCRPHRDNFFVVPKFPFNVTQIEKEQKEKEKESKKRRRNMLIYFSQ